MESDKTVTATFVEETYSLTVNIVGSGLVNLNDTGPYLYGTVVELTAVPSAGWSFFEWSVDLSGSENPTTIVMESDKTVTATFVEETYVFADGFESGDFASWDGTSISSGETASVVTTPSYHGSYTARFTSNGGSSVEDAYIYKIVDMNEAYVSGYFYLDSSLPLTDNSDRFYFLRLLSSHQNGLVYAGIRRDGGVDKWAVYTLDLYYPSWVYAETPLPQNGRWYHVELHWKMDSIAGLVELYVDGAKIIEVTGINTAWFGNAIRVDFGLIRATGVQNSLTVYGDSAVVSQSYIGPEPSSETSFSSAGLMSTFEGALEEGYILPTLMSSLSTHWLATSLLLLALAIQTVLGGRKLFEAVKKKAKTTWSLKLISCEL